MKYVHGNWFLSIFIYLIEEYPEQFVTSINTFSDYFATFRNLKSRTKVNIHEVMTFLVTNVGKIAKLQHKHFSYQIVEYNGTIAWDSI